MDNGWIKLYRCSIESRVFNNEGLLKVWIWCLLKANHSAQWVNLKTGRGSIEVECKAGQFIFGRNSAAKELDMDGNTVWKRMQKLKNIENLTIESNKQYSIITIMNWHTYQTDEKESNSKSNKQVTSKQPASNTNKNEKNVKNEKKKDIYIDFPNLNKEAWLAWKAYKRKIKCPYKTERGEEVKIKALIKLSNGDKDEQRKLVDNAIDEEWKGIHPINNQKNKKTSGINWLPEED